MEITTLCAVVAVLRVDPSRSQFFRYESVSVSCEQQGNSSDWRVKRNTSRNINEECFTPWNETDDSFYLIDALYPSDSGVYWCESAAGGCSDAVSITVTDGPVILESPALPVMEGDDVTLSCRNQTTSSSLPADFYKDGLLIRSSSTGNMTIPRVSQSDEGLYKCAISGEESPESRLTVRAGRPDPPEPALVHSLLPVVASVSLVALLLLLLLLLCIWRHHKDSEFCSHDQEDWECLLPHNYVCNVEAKKGKVDPDVSYTDVIIAQEVKPNRNGGVGAAPTLYSAVKPANSSTSVNVWM